MKDNLSWKELLILGGFLIESLDQNNFNIRQENFHNIRFLREILDQGEIIYQTDYKVISLFSEPPVLKSWLELLHKVGGRCGELICDPQELQLAILDVPMLALVRQLNRLGMHTRYSCSGHGKEKPIIYFSDRYSASMACRVINNLGFNVRLRGADRIELSESGDRLFELGLSLSELSDIGEEELLRIARYRQEKMLEELLMIPGESGNEDGVRKYIMSILPGIVDKVTVDAYGNILAIKKKGIGPTILLSAHMDVKSYFNQDSKIIKSGHIWKREHGILGADDRAGVAMIISILHHIDNTDFAGTLKIAFTVEEEIGQNGAENIEPVFFWDVDYAISLDRRNGSDIVICSSSLEYCGKEYGAIFENVSDSLWDGCYSYKMTRGGISDLRVWSQMGIQSVNLSIGYYNEHTSGEELNLEEYHRTYDLVMAALPEIKKWYIGIFVKVLKGQII
jgi:tripeptide aminopeptidase